MPHSWLRAGACSSIEWECFTTCVNESNYTFAIASTHIACWCLSAWGHITKAMKAGERRILIPSLFSEQTTGISLYSKDCVALEQMRRKKRQNSSCRSTQLWNYMLYRRYEISIRFSVHILGQRCYTPPHPQKKNKAKKPSTIKDCIFRLLK